VLIYNFADIGYSYLPAKALVSGNTITLDPNQVIGGGLTINGSGAITGTSTINWNYTISDGATLRHVVSVYSKR
jgi:UDP-3-O-[3-hydroxymyristoyl] glucosamine N-acyltransferase